MELSNILQLLWACMKSSALTVRDSNKKSRTGNHKILFLSPASLSLDRSKRAGREEENVASSGRETCKPSGRSVCES